MSWIICGFMDIAELNCYAYYYFIFLTFWIICNLSQFLEKQVWQFSWIWINVINGGKKIPFCVLGSQTLHKRIPRGQIRFILENELLFLRVDISKTISDSALYEICRRKILRRTQKPIIMLLFHLWSTNWLLLSVLSEVAEIHWYDTREVASVKLYLWMRKLNNRCVWL